MAGAQAPPNVMYWPRPCISAFWSVFGYLQCTCAEKRCQKWTVRRCAYFIYACMLSPCMWYQVTCLPPALWAYIIHGRRRLCGWMVYVSCSHSPDIAKMTARSDVRCSDGQVAMRYSCAGIEYSVQSRVISWQLGKSASIDVLRCFYKHTDCIDTYVPQKTKQKCHRPSRRCRT